MSKFLKRLLCLLLAVLMCAALFTACKEEEEEDDGPAATPKPVPENLVASIKLSGYTYFDQAQNLDAYYAVFNGDYPGVEVTIERNDVSTELYFDAMDAIMDSDNIEAAGDVILLDAPRMEKYAQQGKIIDLTEYVGNVMNYDTFKKINPASDLLPAAYNACFYNGEMYMVAIEYNHKFVFLNYSMIQKAGYDFPKDDWTWDDMIEIAEALKALGYQNPIAMDYSDYAIWGAFARSYGQDIYDVVGNSDTKELNLTNPAVVQGITDLADIVNPERGLVECLDSKDIDAKDLSKYAFVVADHEDITLWESYICSEECDFSWDYIHFPRWEDENYEENKEYYQAIAADVYGFAVVNHGKDETYTDEFYRACAYLALYATVTDAAKAYAMDGESVPANKNANAQKFWREYPEAGKNSSVFSNFAETADFAGSLGCFMPVMSENEIDIMYAIQNYWDNTRSMLDSLQDLQNNAIASWITR